MKNTIFILLSFLFISCYDREAKVNKAKLTGYDFRLFQDTPVWTLAKAVEDEDSVTLKEIILNEKPNLNYKELRFGNTLLMLAVVNNKYESVKILLNANASPNTPNNYRGTSAIIDAAANDEPKYLKLLLSHGGNPNALENAPVRENDSARSTPLNTAISLSSINTLDKVKLLVDSGADINYCNEGNPTYTALPLADAFIHEKLDVALYLLKRGADYNKVMYIMVDDHKVYILEALRKVVVDLDTEEYKDKLKVIKFLQGKGLNYYHEPIPGYIIKEIKQTYPKKWSEFVKKY